MITLNILSIMVDLLLAYFFVMFTLLSVRIFFSKDGLKDSEQRMYYTFGWYLVVTMLVLIFKHLVW